MTRRLLYVAYFFPPVGGVSVPRTLGFIRHLPRLGWTATVLTPRRASHHLKDPNAVASVPAGTSVVRTAIVEPSDFRRLLRAFVGLGRGARSSATKSSGAAAAAELTRWRRLLFFPDDHVGWLPMAVVAGVRAHRASPFNAVFSSSSPVSAHLIGGLVARVTGVPWIAEFRDPWVGSALAPPLPWFHRALARRIERWIVGRANACVFVTPALTAMYRRRYPRHAARFSTVTNGYDLDLNVPRTRATMHETADGMPQMTLLYAGTVDRPEELRLFLDGLRLWHARRHVQRLRVDFVGHASHRCLELLQEARDAAGDGSVRYSGFVPRAEIRRLLAQVDAALVLLGPGPGMGLFVSGKLFDYIGADVPVFAVVPPGDARHILEELDWGVVVEPEPNSVADALERLMDAPPGRSVADPERRYERQAIVARLAAVLDAVTAKGHA